MEHFIDSENPGDLSDNFISALLVDSKGILWIGNSAGLEKFDNQKQTFIHYKITTKSPEAPSFPADNGITAITQLKLNHLWLGTPSGLVDFEMDTGEYKLFPHHYNIFRFGWGRIIQIISDHNGKFWLASPGELMLFDPVKKSYQYFRNDPLDPNSMSYNAVSSICLDRSGIIWIGTPGAGINIY